MAHLDAMQQPFQNSEQSPLLSMQLSCSRDFLLTNDYFQSVHLGSAFPTAITSERSGWMTFSETPLRTIGS